MEAGQRCEVGQSKGMEIKVLNELRAALQQRLSVIGDTDARQSDPAAHLERLKIASEAITAAQSQLPNDADLRLRHYLDRSSYDKALEWIEDYRE